MRKVVMSVTEGPLVVAEVAVVETADSYKVQVLEFPGSEDERDLTPSYGMPVSFGSDRGAMSTARVLAFKVKCDYQAAA